jgi:hypothetical protein
MKAGVGWHQVPPPFGGVGQGGRTSGPDHHLGIEHLVDCIQYDQKPVLSIEHALHVVEIIEKAGLASMQGQTLTLETTF